MITIWWTGRHLQKYKEAVHIGKEGRDEGSYTRSHTYDHVTSLLWQEPEEKLNKLLLTKVSDRDWNVKGKKFWLSLMCNFSYKCFTNLKIMFKDIWNVKLKFCTCSATVCQIFIKFWERHPEGLGPFQMEWLVSVLLLLLLLLLCSV